MIMISNKGRKKLVFATYLVFINIPRKNKKLLFEGRFADEHKLVTLNTDNVNNKVAQSTSTLYLHYCSK